MNNLIKLSALAAFLMLSAATCKNSEKAAQPTAAAAEPSQTEQKGAQADGYHAAHAFNSERADTAAGILQVKEPPTQHIVPVNEIKPPNTSRRAYMGTGWWFPKMAIQPTDTSIHRQYLGKFMKFRDDQTFDIIQQGKVAETGHWNFDDDKYILYLSCRDPYLNNTWKVMEKGFTMILLGQTSLNFSGIQIRLDNIKTPPPGM